MQQRNKLSPQERAPSEKYLESFGIEASSLYDHQVEWLVQKHKKHLVCFDLGTGKTRLSIEWAKMLGVPVLIIVPKGLVDNWVRECGKWNLQQYTIITKEKFKKMAHELPRFDAVIVDEAHVFSGASQLNKALQYYVDRHAVPNIVCLTGTPYIRSAWNVYRLGHILGMKGVWKYPVWDYQFFNKVRMGFKTIPVQKQDEATKRSLARLVNDIGSTKHLSDCADVPVSQEYSELVEYTDEQRKVLSELIDVDPIVRFTKEHQITGGYLKGDAYRAEQMFTSAKRDRLMELVGQNDKVMVVCRYVFELEQLALCLEKMGRTVYVLHGAVKNRDEVIQAARKADECVLLVGAQLSEGWEIPEIETMIFYSHDFSLKNYVQMKGRVQRINDLRPRCYVHLLVKGSVDEGVYKSLLNKHDFLIHIYAQTGTGNNSSTQETPAA